MANIDKAAKLWQEAKNVLVLSGAGMSTASGLPDFRSKTGLWKQRPEQLATLHALRNTPNEFYFFYQWRIKQLWQAKPNIGHDVLNRMENNGLVDMIVTQNVDGFHQRAGSKNVVELHGTLHTVSCIDCAKEYNSQQLVPESVDLANKTSDGYKYGDECKCTICGGFLRPDVVLFGEQLPHTAWQSAVKQASKSDLVVVLGSSLLVGPANQLPHYALENGSKFIIINNDATPLDNLADVVINADIVNILVQIEKM